MGFGIVICKLGNPPHDVAFQAKLRIQSYLPHALSVDVNVSLFDFPFLGLFYNVINSFL